MALVAIALLTGLGTAQELSLGKSHKVTTGEPAEVWHWNRQIVTLRAGIDNLDAAARAQGATERLEELPDSALEGEVTATHAQLGDLKGVFLMVDQRIIVGLLPEDIDPESGLTLDQYADAAAAKLREVLAAQVEHRKLPVLLRSLGLSLAATLGFVAVVWLAVRGRRLALAELEGRLAKRKWEFAGVDIAQYFFASQRLMARLTAAVILAAAAYVWLTFVLVEFPYTRPWGQNLGSFLKNEFSGLGHAFLSAIPGLFTVVLILFLTRAVGRVVNTFFARVEAGYIHVTWLEPESAKATRRITIGMLWLSGLVIAYPHLPGSNSDAFKGVSVLAGLMITLGSSGLVNQVMSGLVVVYSRALKVGDFVRIDDLEGTVTAVGLLSTKIVTHKREEVTIPNAVVIGDRVTNYTRLSADGGAVVSTTMTIGYDTPWRQVHALLLMAASRTSKLRKDSTPIVLQRALSDFYVEYELRVHLDRPETRVAMLSELHGHLQDVFNEFGVQIMSPHFEAQPHEKVFVSKEHWRAAPAKSEAEK